MISAVLVPQTPDLTQLAESIEGRSVLYLSNPDYVLYLVSEQIPVELSEKIVPAQLEIEYQEPLSGNQRYYSSLEELFNPVQNRELISRRSRLSYLITEYLTPDGFYFELDSSKNEDQTYRSYRYQLYYHTIPCLTTPEILANLIKIEHDMTLGPLIVSTFTLSSTPAPLWYVRETLRDLFELDEIDSSGKVLVEGPMTGELYLFYTEPTNLTDDILVNLALEIQGRLKKAVQLRIFPRNTPQLWIQNRRLVRQSSGQWTLPYSNPETVPENVPVLAERLRQTFILTSLETLFWMLIWLQLSPTWFFIEAELKISIYPNQIVVNYDTGYLPDYLRVLSASQIEPSAAKFPTDVMIKPFYPDRESASDINTTDGGWVEHLRGKTWVKIRDDVSSERIVLYADLPSDWRPPNIITERPSDLSLESRLSADPEVDSR